MINPQQDGFSHINIYSRGKTKLGKKLSNFALSPIETEDGWFKSIEGYWYWLNAEVDEPRREELQNLWGYRAKAIGKEICGASERNDASFKAKICQAITIKINTDYQLQQLLIANNLPYEHYYVYGDKVIDVASKYRWILDHIESCAQFLKNQ